MSKTDTDTYDAVIIGAGIGGLVCGCYLAKAGMRVLITERHNKPGGYCTSFTRKGFTFDAAAHSFGGHKYGNLGKIFDGLSIEKKITISRFDPSDIVVTPDYKVSFWADLDKTIAGLQTFFPEEADNIKRLFHFLINPDPMYFAQIRSWTFIQLLDQYVTDAKLKAILSFPLYGNGGLPPTRMSAFIGAKIFKEFLLDGGYYPAGGMQALSDALAERFREFGGELRLSSCVKKIAVVNNAVRGVTLERGEYIPSRTVVSNCDARHTFLDLIGKNLIGQPFFSHITNMVQSISMFILYLGIDETLCTLLERSANIWVMYHYDLESTYLSAKNGDFNNLGGYLLHMSPEKKSILAFINTSSKNDKFWNDHKQALSDLLIKRIEVDIIPELSKHVLYKDAATPKTLFRYTHNYKGAAFGWEHSPSQLADADFKSPSFIRGLYLAGHWTTSGLGIPGVTYLGWDVANLILKKTKHIKSALI
jgi:phytoene dehydrogenase-like protein